MSVIHKRVCDLCMTDVAKRKTVTTLKITGDGDGDDRPRAADVCNECEEKPIEMLMKVLRRPQ